MSTNQNGISRTARLIGGRSAVVRHDEAADGDGTRPPSDSRKPEPLRARVAFQNAALVLLSACSVALHAFMPDQYESYYGVTAGPVAAMTFIFFTTHILTGPFVAVLLTEHGEKRALVAASVLNAVGAALKLFSLIDGKFEVLLIGQCCAAVALEIAISAPAMVAARWFPRSERGSAVVAVAISETIGFAIAAVLPLIVVVHSVHYALLGTFFSLFLAASAETVAAMFLQPPFPFYGPAEGERAAAEANAHCVDLLGGLRGVRLAALRLITTNVDFAILAATAGTSMGLFWVYTFTMPSALEPFGFSDATTGGITFLKLTASVPIAVGIVGMLDHSRRYRKYLLCLLGGIAVFMALIATTVGAMRDDESGNNVAFIICVGGFNVFLGVAQAALPAVALEHVAEVSFPTAPGVSGTVFIWIAHCVGAFWLLIVVLLVPPEGGVSRVRGRAYFTVIAVVSALAFFGALFVSNRRRRREDEEERDEIRAERHRV